MKKETTMPLRVFILLISFVIILAALTIGAALLFGLPMAMLGMFAVLASLGLRLWMSRT